MAQKRATQVGKGAWSEKGAFWKNEPILDGSKNRSKWCIFNNLQPKKIKMIKQNGG